MPRRAVCGLCCVVCGGSEGCGRRRWHTTHLRTLSGREGVAGSKGLDAGGRGLFSVAGVVVQLPGVDHLKVRACTVGSCTVGGAAGGVGRWGGVGWATALCDSPSAVQCRPPRSCAPLRSPGARTPAARPHSEGWTMPFLLVVGKAVMIDYPTYVTTFDM